MPLGLILLALIVLFLLSAMIWFTAGLIALGLHLLVAGLVGAAADAIAPGKLPWGWVGAILAGLLGSWLGVMLVGSRGPHLFGVPIVQAFIGALILAFAVSAVRRVRTAS
jgi:uncharacterized membrane protein YeaQ/YmgE (transglycosylase-associated protein family)